MLDVLHVANELGVQDEVVPLRALALLGAELEDLGPDGHRKPARPWLEVRENLLLDGSDRRTLDADDAGFVVLVDQDEQDRVALVAASIPIPGGVIVVGAFTTKDLPTVWNIGLELPKRPALYPVIAGAQRSAPFAHLPTPLQ